MDTIIPEFVAQWEKNKHLIRECFTKEHPGSYGTIVQALFENIKDIDPYCYPNPKGMKSLDFGDYQGTEMFVIPEDAYQPSVFWIATVSYGSCSGCDTLQGIHDYGDDPPTERQVDEYMTLALHILQSIRRI